MSLYRFDCLPFDLCEEEAKLITIVLGLMKLFPIIHRKNECTVLEDQMYVVTFSIKVTKYDVWGYCPLPAPSILSSLVLFPFTCNRLVIISLFCTVVTCSVCTLPLCGGVSPISCDSASLVLKEKHPLCQHAQ